MQLDNQSANPSTTSVVAASAVLRIFGDDPAACALRDQVTAAWPTAVVSTTTAQAQGSTTPLTIHTIRPCPSR